jgi:hypothetical protein
MKPTIGRIVIVRNLCGQYSQEEAAMITRVWGANDPATDGAVSVNLSVLADCQSALINRTSVPLFNSRDAADAYLLGLVGHSPCVCHWPDREPQAQAAVMPLAA